MFAITNWSFNPGALFRQKKTPLTSQSVMTAVTLTEQIQAATPQNIKTMDAFKECMDRASGFEGRSQELHKQLWAGRFRALPCKDAIDSFKEQAFGSYKTYLLQQAGLLPMMCGVSLQSDAEMCYGMCRAKRDYNPYFTLKQASTIFDPRHMVIFSEIEKCQKITSKLSTEEKFQRKGYIRMLIKELRGQEDLLSTPLLFRATSSITANDYVQTGNFSDFLGENLTVAENRQQVCCLIKHMIRELGEDRVEEITELSSLMAFMIENYEEWTHSGGLAYARCAFDEMLIQPEIGALEARLSTIEEETEFIDQEAVSEEVEPYLELAAAAPLVAEEENNLYLKSEEKAKS